MIRLVKDGLVTHVKDKASATIYLNNGWKEAAEEAKPVEVVEPTKKELQEQLDKLGIKYKPTDNKAALQEKLKSAEPADDFDDGLLKE